MDPIGVWVRKNGEWPVIHRCPTLLMSIAVKPLATPPFPLWQVSGQA